MASKIRFNCESCNFQFTDSNSIFYFNELGIVEETLNMTSSKKMSESPLAGFIYESYCPECQEYIKTYLPENYLISFSKREIKELLNEYMDKKSGIIFLDFKNSTGIERRNILKKGKCPNCKKDISLIFTPNNPCPICGSKIIESSFE